MTELAATMEGDRVHSVDMLRGAALFGVLMANLLTEFRVSLFAYLQRFHTHPGWANRLTDLGLSIFIEGKAFALFSLLFGAGLAMQAGRSRARGADYLRFALRRQLVLLLLGLMHLIFIWNGDILTAYAVIGLLALPALWLPERVGLSLALLFLLLPALPLAWPGPALAAPAVAAQAEAATRVYAHGGVAEIFWFRQHETRHFILPLLAASGSRVLGLMLLGQVLWRRGVVRDPQAHRRLLRGAVALGLGGGLGANLGGVVLGHAHLELGAWDPLLRALSTTPLALGYGALGLLLLQHPRARRALSMIGLGALGRMALTNYLAQSVVLSLVFYGYGGYGLGLFGRLGPAAAAPIGVALFAAQLGGSVLWLRRFHFGPVEWLWRSLSYGRAQPLRRTGAS